MTTEPEALTVVVFFFLVRDGNYWSKLRCERGCFLGNLDLVVPSIRKEPNRADVSLEDQSCSNPAYTPNHSYLYLFFFFSQCVLEISQQLNAY